MKVLSERTIRSIMMVRDEHERGTIMASTPPWLAAIKGRTQGKMGVGRMIAWAVELVAVSACHERGLWLVKPGSDDEVMIEMMESAGA